jgi:solute carrier family 35 protein E3
MEGSLVTLGWIIGSIASSTSIILMNKHVMDNFHFNSPIFLTAYHFIMTWGLLEIMCRAKLFERATTFPQPARWFLGAASVGGVVFMNFNLKMNSVGFYQLSKLLVIPTIVIYNFFFENKSTPIPVLCSLAILLVGIALFTVNDVQVNLPGSFIAVLAVLFVAVSQSQTGVVQKAYGINGPSAQHATAFHQFLMALVSGIIVETHGSGSIFTHEFAQTEVVIILLTGVVSVSVNVCAFGLIGKTSAVTYQVVGHCKTILIFVFGLIMFPPKQDETSAQFTKKIAGLVVSMSGMMLYTYLELKAKSASAEKAKDEQRLLPQPGESHGDGEINERE